MSNNGFSNIVNLKRKKIDTNDILIQVFCPPRAMAIISIDVTAYVGDPKYAPRLIPIVGKNV